MTAPAPCHALPFGSTKKQTPVDHRRPRHERRT